MNKLTYTVYYGSEVVAKDVSPLALNKLVKEDAKKRRGSGATIEEYVVKADGMPTRKGRIVHGKVRWGSTET